MTRTLDVPAQQYRPGKGLVGFASVVGLMCGVVIGPTVALSQSSDPEVGVGMFFTSAIVGGILEAILMGMLGFLGGVSLHDSRPGGSRSSLMSFVVGMAAFVGVLAILFGFGLLPLILVGAAIGEDATIVFSLGVPISLVATGCGLMLISRRATWYAKTFSIAAPFETVVEKVVIWGSGAKRTDVTLGETTVTFTRRYRPVAWGILLGTLWLFVWAALGVMFPISSGLIAAASFLVLGSLFLFVRTTETLTVAATASEEGSQVVIGGQAAPGLIRQLERLMATSPKGPTPKLPARPKVPHASSPNAYGF